MHLARYLGCLPFLFSYYFIKIIYSFVIFAVLLYIQPSPAYNTLRYYLFFVLFNMVLLIFIYFIQKKILMYRFRDLVTFEGLFVTQSAAFAQLFQL